jgi:hypothetical protein
MCVCMHARMLYVCIYVHAYRKLIPIFMPVCIDVCMYVYVSQIDPSDPSALEPPKTSHAPPSRKNSFSIAPPRRETSKAGM